MNENPMPFDMPRQPLQKRAKERFENVLGEAKIVLQQEGLTGFSIPVIAERLGYLRGTVYNLFPTPNALLNELALRYLTELETLLNAKVQTVTQNSWKTVVKIICETAARFYNENPVASMLLLGGPVTHDSYRAFEMSIQRLGGLGRLLFQHHGFFLPSPPPDIGFLSVEIAVSCFRVSVLMHGEITPQYEQEATRAMVAYLSEFVAKEVM